MFKDIDIKFVNKEKRPGRNSHHPLIAFVSDIRMIANYWLRPGNTSASTNYLSFLEDSLENLDGKKVGLIRMDSGFFSGEILDYLEMKALNYIVACRFGLQFLLAVPARLDQLPEEEFPQDNPLRTDKHPGLFLQKQGQTRPLPCPLSENTLRVPRDLDSP